MRIPADFDRYKSDGRTIEINLNHPLITLSGDPEDAADAARFVDWLRSNGWTVDTEYRGGMAIGGRTVDEDQSVLEFAKDLIVEFSLMEQGVVY